MSAGRLLGGRYEVGEVIGRGGMADVHLGFDTRLSRPVAIKILRPDLARDGSFLARFKREAQSAAGLNHPSIVAIFDSGEETHTDPSTGHEVTSPYIVMEVVEGQTLRERLQAHGPLPADEAARIVEGVLAALAYSHRMGIVHRDIKPANVMLTETGEVKVMDFGIARALADTHATMTQTQAVVGTAQYLSPEQAQGKPVDARSDLYSTGCMLFELLTGRTPFVGDTPVSIAYQHVGETPQPPSTLRSGIDPAYDAIVLHAMAKDREDRYQSANDFRADLICAREGRAISPAAATAVTVLTAPPTAVIEPVRPTPVPPPARVSRRGDTGEMPVLRDDEEPRRRGWAWLAAVLVAAVILGAVFLFGRQLIGGSKPEQVKVPYVVTKSEADARRDIEAARLYMDVTAVEDPSVEPGRVLEQNPKQDTMVNVGSRVAVKVSRGPGQAAVPQLVGLQKDAAVQAVKALGFADPVITPVDDPAQAKDAVVSSDPPTGSVIPLSRQIQIKVASGKVKMPKVTGMHTTTAKAAVESLKLRYVEERVPNDKELEGTVLEQSAAADSLVDVGSEIKVKVAVKPPPPTATVTATVTATPTATTTKPSPTTP